MINLQTPEKVDKAFNGREGLSKFELNFHQAADRNLLSIR